LAIAQNGDLDEVYLKNGSILKGEILKYNQGENLTLKIGDEQIIVIQEANIKEIIQGEVDIREEGEETTINFPEIEPIEKVPFEYKMEGWYNTTYISFYAGNDGNTDDGNGNFKLGSGLHNVVGKQLNQFVGLGLGLGLDNYSRRGETIVPLFAELRGYPITGAKQLYYSFSLGYGFAFKRESFGIVDANGGYMIQPAVGLRLGTPDGTNVNIDLGYRIQKAFFREQLVNGDVDERNIIFNRLALRVGLTLWK
jgi:hypothetical protein